MAELEMVDLQRSREFHMDGDNPAQAFSLLENGQSRGLSGVLITIVGIEGGAPRALGSHMAVLEDGTYCGYISGGCVEAAVAGEALRILRSGKDAVLRFGRNSPFMDVRLPCGGGVDLHIHVRPDPQMVSEALRACSRRQAFVLVLDPEKGTSVLTCGPSVDCQTGWQDGAFHRLYTPQTRLVLIGRGLEFEALARLGRAAALDLVCFSPDDQGLELTQSLGIPSIRLGSLTDAPRLPVDPWTAVVLLFHDHDWETTLLRQAVKTDAFFIGALGSKTTHQARCRRLAQSGIGEAALARIHGPIGLFGPVRQSTSLAISVLAQIAQHRASAEQQ